MSGTPFTPFGGGFTPTFDAAILTAEIAATRREFQTQVDSLRALTDERDRRYGSQFDNISANVVTALASAEKAVNAAFLASEKAVLKAEDAQREYNQRSNEFRGQLDDQAKTLMPRTEAGGQFDAINARVSAMQAAFDNELRAQRVVTDKDKDATMREIAGLRESRSQGEGRGVAVVEQRASVGEIRAWALAAITFALAIVTIMGFVLVR